ncbi:MAG TPA: TIGR00730 family Rossman fold protein, partial [Pyrinomonadaceae bacterium]|nr:TIGR00730 family Rossman fold protein [Pyrinomonadaceae bacterium]
PWGNTMRSITVFCGSNSGFRGEYAEAARQLGALFVREGIGLVYGGGKVGLMGIIADQVMNLGGRVTGIIPESLEKKEVGHRDVTELLVVGSMHERKALMAERADGFIAMPGGIGTFEEFFEILTWAQLGFHQKPCAILNISGYYDGLLALCDQAVNEGFLRREHRRLILEDSDPERLLAKMRDFTPSTLEKWLDQADI